MDQYRILLALSYFKEKNGQYSISELMLILGFNNKQISDLIELLLNSKYLEYNNDCLLTITSRGIAYLIANDGSEIEFNAVRFLSHIAPEKALPIDEPYVPKNFAKKFKR